VNQSTNYSLLRLLSTVGGLGLVGVAAFLNAAHAAETEGVWSPVCVAIVALAFGSALSVPVACALWRNGRRGLALLALVGLISSESFGFELSAERLLDARQRRAQQVVTAGNPFAQGKEALALAISERKEECASGLGRKCSQLRALEDEKRAALSVLQVPSSPHLVADFTGLPIALVEVVPALAFSSGLLILGFVCIAFGAHGSPERREVVEAVLEPVPDEREKVVSWVQAYRQRHGRLPQISAVQEAFGLPKTTAWRRIEQSRK
jgi:hypothetical protein